MDLCVIYSDFHDEATYYVVDFNTMQEKTAINPETGDDYPEYSRLDEKEEKKALAVYISRGNEIWNVTSGGDADFFIAKIQEVDSDRYVVVNEFQHPGIYFVVSEQIYDALKEDAPEKDLNTTYEDASPEDEIEIMNILSGEASANFESVQLESETFPYIAAFKKNS